MPVAQAEAFGRSLALQAQRLHLLIQRAGVGLHRLGLLAQPPLLVRGQYGQLRIGVLLRLDHVGPGIGDLLVQLDLLGGRGAGLTFGSFEHRDLRLVGIGDLGFLLFDDRGALGGVRLLRDNACLLCRIQFLLVVLVLSQNGVEGVLLRIEAGEINSTSARDWVLVLLGDVAAHPCDSLRIESRVGWILLPDDIQRPFVLLERLAAFLGVGPG
ncbi:hypothetical protein D3C81_1227190 [compost metagenome]